MKRLLFSVLLSLLVGSTAWAEVLHPGDTLSITVWQDSKLDRNVIIGPDGKFAFPLAGHLRAAGLSPEAVEKELTRRLQKNYSDPLNVTVGLAGLNKEEEDLSRPKIYISGEVLRPGEYPIPRRTNIAQALALAGGLGPFAARGRIQVHRKIHGEDSIILFNYRAYQSGEDGAQNINLRGGDTIIVPERGLLGGLFE